ncbi:hypothetical protein SAMN02745129_0903 [Ferrimonas marina]|uniref:Uncharacterized protein n=2 Tax=Ferrimonas marina TaxID=299255 RepID=A0A1M5N5N8_9GAMM|nr:hypothetical protein SAMN02745129_0903 [Ferrimonas marina]
MEQIELLDQRCTGMLLSMDINTVEMMLATYDTFTEKLAQFSLNLAACYSAQLALPQCSSAVGKLIQTSSFHDCGVSFSPLQHPPLSTLSS